MAMEFRYNPELDPAELAAEFKKRGRISIRDIWPDEIAEQLHDWLANKVSWGLAYNDGDRAVVLRHQGDKILNKGVGGYLVTFRELHIS